MPIFLIDFLTAIAESFIRVPLVRWLVTDRASSASSSSLLAQTLCPGSSLTEVTRDRYKANEVRLKIPSLISPESVIWEGGLGRRLIRLSFPEGAERRILSRSSRKEEEMDFQPRSLIE
jgi:hypothetical protein